MIKRNNVSQLVFAGLFFSALLAVFFPDVFFRGKIFLSPMGDLHLVNYSWAAFFHDMIQRGIWPLWNPFVYCGAPYGAGAVSHVSIANFLVLIFKDVPTAWNIQVLANVFLAAFATFLYMRKMSVSIGGALIAGTLVGFLPASGSYIDSWPLFLPIGLWLLEEFYTTRRKYILVLLVFIFWVMILNALPQYTLYTGFIFALYALARFRSLSGVLILIFAVGLASFYIFRLLELLSVSPRGNMWFVNVLMPSHFINMTFPFLFESPFRPETNFFFPKIFGEIAQRFFHQEKLAYLTPPYITIAGFSFVLFTWRLKGPLSFFRGVVIGIFLYLMTFPFLAPLYEKIPLLAKLPRVGRLYPILTFSLAVLAGWGSDKILNKGFRIKPIAIFYGAVCGALLAGLGLIRAVFHFFYDPIHQFFSQYIQTHIVSNEAYQASGEFYLGRVDQFFAFINTWTQWWTDPSILVPIGLIAAFLLLLVAWRLEKVRKTFFLTAILFLILFDILFTFRLPQSGTASRSEITAPSAAIGFLQEQPGIFRVTTVLEEAEVGVGRERDILAPNLNLHYGLFGIEGYDPMFPGRYSEFVKNFQSDYEPDPASVLSGPETGFDYKMMDFLNVRYFFTKKDVILKKNLPLAFEDPYNKIYLNPDFLPQAFLVTDYRLASEKQKILDALRDPAFNFRTTVVLEKTPQLLKRAIVTPFDPESVSFARYESDRVLMDVAAPQDALLVFSMNYYPGWKALLDGREVPIYRSNYTFCSIEIPQGEHQVEFLFQPASYRWGLVVSLFFLILGVVVLVKMPRKRTSGKSGIPYSFRVL